MPTPPNNLRDFKSFVEIVQALRGPEGCPWDKEQTHKTLTRYAIEETYELVEAIESGSISDMRDELGDVLLQVVLHSEISRQNGEFDINDVIESIGSKMVRRHPHVFARGTADGAAKTPDEVIKKWDEIKAEEKAQKKSKSESTDSSTNEAHNPFSNLPKALPALQRSQKIGGKTVRFNFDWSQPSEVLAKLDEEIAELKEAIESKSLHEQNKELGDVLFTVAQLARHLNLDAEQALREGNSKFETRFLKMRQLVEAEKKDFGSLSTGELEVYWQKAKKLERM
ncbi:MAG: nucleoside triphosphate pyrophosphohydrolase [Bdellovibrionota bacterium]